MLPAQVRSAERRGRRRGCTSRSPLAPGRRPGGCLCARQGRGRAAHQGRGSLSGQPGEPAPADARAALEAAGAPGALRRPAACGARWSCHRSPDSCSAPCAHRGRGQCVGGGPADAAVLRLRRCAFLEPLDMRRRGALATGAPASACMRRVRPHGARLCRAPRALLCARCSSMEMVTACSAVAQCVPTRQSAVAVLRGEQLCARGCFARVRRASRSGPLSLHR